MILNKTIQQIDSELRAKGLGYLDMTPEEMCMKMIEMENPQFFAALTHMKRLEGEFRQNANYLERSMKQFPDNKQFFGAWSEANECADRLAEAIKDVKNNQLKEK